MTLLIAGVVALLAVAASSLLSPRLRVASPLILVVAGIVVSFLPFIPTIHVDPEWILAGVLPPLLYSASVSMPSMNFRRELTAIGGLSVVLVVLSSVILGLFFALVIPGLGIWWGIALGAIVSPTDAVATSIVKRVGVSGRVVSVLEGESLLNDATALVLLRSAIAGAAASVSLWGVLGTFAYSVVIASILGVVVGQLNLWVRAKISDSTVNTVVSFTVPFLASIPAELLGASGLVAAVVAGLVTGHGAARRLPPQHRLSDTQNWRTVELVLEGVIFLVMGLELSGLITQVRVEHAGVAAAFGVAALALALTVAVRAGYIFPLLASLRRRSRRGEGFKSQLDVMKQRFDARDAALNAIGPSGDGLPDPEQRRLALEQLRVAADSATSPGSAGGVGVPAAVTPGTAIPVGYARPDDRLNRGRSRRRRPRKPPSEKRIAWMRTRTIRTLADIDYYLDAPLGWREGGVLVWAGMRGAVTLAAAQTLPENTPNRSLLVLIAFALAAFSLIVQGGTLSAVVKWLKPASPDTEATDEERRQIIELLRKVASDVMAASTAAEAAPDAERGDFELDAAEPDAAEADATEPDATESDVTESDDIEPDAAEPEATESDDVEPDAVEEVATASSVDPTFSADRRLWKQRALDIIEAQRSALLDASDDGIFSAEVLNRTLANLDADQISIELKGAPPEI
ncbi:cation:proton antiporter [Subtercola lobariae]|uniref:Cation/H+ exchanger transmembrane domain-containing protein n=1 Tax=Subtercola lobariae TaxID=1588641 RepID=A0A917EX09_9MICO|nr:cation:proton antiporter [Subtercola lobariae]GGF17536.1 hypothetical protein GCM10011399_09110 [Subtercola lobariae]